MSNASTASSSDWAAGADRPFENRPFENRQFENRQFENRQFENRQFENRPSWALRERA